MFEYSSFVEFIGLGYVFFPMLLGFLSIAAAAVIGVGYLSKNGKKKASAAIIIVVFLLGTGNAVNLGISTEDATGGSGNLLIWNDAQSMDRIGVINYVPDRKDNNILAFGKLKVTSGKAPEYLDLEFDKNHQMIGSPEAMKYKKAIEASLEGSWKKSIEGKSMTLSELRQFQDGKTTKHFSKSTFLFQFLLNNIVTFILILIYFAINYRERRRKANKMDRSKIQDL